MKTLNVTFTDAEYRKLRKAKLKLEGEHKSFYSWHKFIFTKCVIEEKK